MDVFSAPEAGVLSLSSAVAVVLTGVTAAVGLVVVTLLAKGAAACLVVAVVLVGVGLCTEDTAGLAAGLGGAAGILETTGLAGLGGAAVVTGGLLVTGVGRTVVDMTLGTAGFSCFTTGGGLGDSTAEAGRNGVESP